MNQETQPSAATLTSVKDAPRGMVVNGVAKLVGRRWFLNLISPTWPFDAGTFPNSVLVTEVTSISVTVQVDDDGTFAVVPWNAIKFIGTTGSIGVHTTLDDRQEAFAQNADQRGGRNPGQAE